VSVLNNDVVLDVGGCWGDTALYFANRVGEFGKVYSFEFIPNNIKIWEINTNLNPILKKRIKLVSNPVLNISNQEIFYLDNGPGSLLSEKIFDGFTGTTKTISLDDFVTNNNIEKVDFIKMDIEGAEPLALEGAINTIKKFKPKLAIAIYHSMEDFVNIPEWILNLNCGYELFLGHYTIHSEETVIFAKVK
jgi:FkbM family methyltransferase